MTMPNASKLNTAVIYGSAGRGRQGIKSARFVKFMDEYEWYVHALKSAREQQPCDQNLPTQQQLCRGK